MPKFPRSQSRNIPNFHCRQEWQWSGTRHFAINKLLLRVVFPAFFLGLGRQDIALFLVTWGDIGGHGGGAFSWSLFKEFRGSKAEVQLSFSPDSGSVPHKAAQRTFLRV